MPAIPTTAHCEAELWYESLLVVLSLFYGANVDELVRSSQDLIPLGSTVPPRVKMDSNPSYQYPFEQLLLLEFDYSLSMHVVEFEKLRCRVLLRSHLCCDLNAVACNSTILVLHEVDLLTYHFECCWHHVTYIPHQAAILPVCLKWRLIQFKGLKCYPVDEEIDWLIVDVFSLSPLREWRFVMRENSFIEILLAEICNGFMHLVPILLNILMQVWLLREIEPWINER